MTNKRILGSAFGALLCAIVVVLIVTCDRTPRKVDLDAGLARFDAGPLWGDATSSDATAPSHRAGASYPQPTGTGLYHATSGQLDPTTYTLVGTDIPWTSAQSIGWATGQVPDFGAAVVNFGSNADMTLSSSQYNHRSLQITDTTPFLTTNRKVIFPLLSGAAAGASWRVSNSTAKVLTAIGDTDTGNGVQIQPNSHAIVNVNAAGTQISGEQQAYGNGFVANSEGTYGVNAPLPNTQVTMAGTLDYPSYASVEIAGSSPTNPQGTLVQGNFVWNTISTFTLLSNAGEAYTVRIFGLDYSGDSGTGGDASTNADFFLCYVEFVAVDPIADAAVVTAQNGTAGPAATVALTPARCTTVVGGVAGNGTNAQFQATIAAGAVSLQVELPDASFPNKSYRVEGHVVHDEINGPY